MVVELDVGILGASVDWILIGHKHIVYATEKIRPEQNNGVRLPLTEIKESEKKNH